MDGRGIVDGGGCFDGGLVGVVDEHAKNVKHGGSEFGRGGTNVSKPRTGDEKKEEGCRNKSTKSTTTQCGFCWEWCQTTDGVVGKEKCGCVDTNRGYRTRKTC